jgi:hypothetical protein
VRRREAAHTKQAAREDNSPAAFTFLVHCKKLSILLY